MKKYFVEHRVDSLTRWVFEVSAPSLRDGAHAALGELLYIARETQAEMETMRVRADDDSETLTLTWERKR